MLMTKAPVQPSNELAMLVPRIEELVRIAESARLSALTRLLREALSEADREVSRLAEASLKSDTKQLRPTTPERLAERWQCSANLVRGLIRRGELRAYRVGRTLRIPADAVEEYESREDR
jgi:excisionase family DNA binding protein